jgi:Cdc6-like AAA superfamily ATPase
MLSLMGMGDLCALSDACVVRARALMGREESSKGFRFVSDISKDEALRPLRLEVTLAEFRWSRRHGSKHEAESRLRAAASVIHRIATSQSPMERAALRVHPWMQEIRQGLL